MSMPRPFSAQHRATAVLAVGFATLLTSCAGWHPVTPVRPKPAGARALIDRLLPGSVSDRAGWSEDIYAGFTYLGIEPTRERVCAVIAITEQESSFQIDPPVSGLGAIAWREIDRRAERAGVPRAIVHGVLQLNSSTGRSYADRIDSARTEKQLSDIFEDFTGSLPLGRTLFASWNPIRTRGPMQVNVAFAEKFGAARPYPYAIKTTLADETFTRRGSLYFGIAHPLAYSAPYDRYLYRFADYNAGQYSSRNAAFQTALSGAAKTKLVTDGALLPHGESTDSPGDTELAVRGLS